MASKAYLDLLKEIPKSIQKDVIGSIDIANEIHLVLSSINKTAADLARLLNKSEPEISKWTLNFTRKTINKIEIALREELLVTKSSKIAEYELKIQQISEKLEELKVRNTLVSLVGFHIQDSFSYSSNDMMKIRKRK